MKSVLTALLVIFLCLPLKGDDITKKKFEQSTALAEKGVVKAQSLLGEMYADGRGVLRDDEEAVNWFRKAADQGAQVRRTILGLSTPMA